MARGPQGSSFRPGTVVIVRIWVVLFQLLESLLFEEIGTYQDSPRSDRDVSAWFNLEALPGGGLAVPSESG